MAAMRLSVMAFFVASVPAWADSGACESDEEDSTLLSVKTRLHTETNWTKFCRNSLHVKFPCTGDCCGDICVPRGAPCCSNSLGNNFGCAVGDSCCGSSCAASGSKCCDGSGDCKYPVSNETPCGRFTECTNRDGAKFLCGAESSCCGDVCSAPGGTCCQNDAGSDFVCAAGDSCCGNACASAGSKCCDNHGVKYPVSQSTLCAGESTSIECRNRHGNYFWCGSQSSCCGDICAGAGSSCCRNYHGNNFVCAPGSRCAGDVCHAN